MKKARESKSAKGGAGVKRGGGAARNPAPATLVNDLRTGCWNRSRPKFSSRYWERGLSTSRAAPTSRDLFDRHAFDRAVLRARAKGIPIRVSFDYEKNSRSVGTHTDEPRSRRDLARGVV